jgi:hypothetical protein
MPGLLRGIARTAVVAGTAAGVAGRSNAASKTSGLRRTAAAAEQPAASRSLSTKKLPRSCRPAPTTSWPSFNNSASSGTPEAYRSRIRGPEGKILYGKPTGSGSRRACFAAQIRHHAFRGLAHEPPNAGSGCCDSSGTRGRRRIDGERSCAESVRAR